MTALTVKDLNWSYNERTVLHSVSLEIPPGTFAAILGRNGSGKSTLLRCMAGMLPVPPDTVFYGSHDIARRSYAERAGLLGYLPQFHEPVFPFRVEEVVLTGRAAQVLFTPSDRDRVHAQEAIHAVGIDHLRFRPYNELSGGERQLVMIARVLAQSPQIILLDEPLSHLDLCNQVHLIKLLKGLADRGTTIITVLHDPTLALTYCDRHIYLRGGSLYFPTDGAYADAEFLSDIYNTRLRVIRSEGIPVVIAE
jgi:iron complex transport system ATP-binding protein